MQNSQKLFLQSWNRLKASTSTCIVMLYMYTFNIQSLQTETSSSYKSGWFIH